LSQYHLSDVNKTYGFNYDFGSNFSHQSPIHLNMTTPQINTSFALNRELKTMKWQILSKVVEYKFDLNFIANKLNVQSMLEVVYNRSGVIRLMDITSISTMIPRNI